MSELSELTKEELELRRRRMATMVVGIGTAINAARWAVEERGGRTESVAYIFEAMEAKRDKLATRVVAAEEALEALEPGYMARHMADLDALLGEA